MRRREFLSASFALGCSLAVVGRAKAAPITMKIGTSTLNDVQHQWMIDFQRRMEEKAADSIKVEIYPASQLGSTTRMIEQTQFNTMQCVIAPPEFMGGLDPRFQVLSAPGLFENLRHTTRALNEPEFNEFMLNLGKDKGLVGAGLFISGPSAFVAREPITKPEGFNGKKVRVLSAEFQMAQIRAMGGAPLPMPPSEVLPALQQGTLDGVMSCLPVFEGLGYMDGAKYLMETNHGVIATIAMISRDWLESLPDHMQKLVMETGKETTDAVTQFSYDDVDDAREQWVKKGGKIVPLSADQKKGFMDVLLPSGPAVVKRMPELDGAYALMTKAIESTRQG